MSDLSVNELRAGQPTIPASVTARRNSPSADGQDDGVLSFSEFLDFINPLQHIPIVSTIYRKLTGDEIDGPARIIGGAIFGGPIGLASGLVSTMVETASGRTPTDHLMAAVGLDGGDDAAEEGTQTAWAIEPEGEPVTVARAETGAAAPAPPETTPPPDALVTRLAADLPTADLQGATAVAPAGGPAPLEADERLDAALMALAGGASALEPGAGPAAAPAAGPALGAPVEGDSRLDAALMALAGGGAAGPAAAQLAMAGSTPGAAEAEISGAVAQAVQSYSYGAHAGQPPLLDKVF